MSCMHGNSDDACDICDEVDEAWNRGYEVGLARAKAGGGWLPIESAPDGVEVLVGWHEDGKFQRMFDAKEEGSWIEHADAYDHFCAVAPGGSRGPKEGAPYTHWMPLPALPSPPKEDGE